MKIGDEEGLAGSAQLCPDTGLGVLLDDCSSCREWEMLGAKLEQRIGQFLGFNGLVM